MPKKKRHSGATKRFSLTGKGKVRHLKANKSHILTHKDGKRLRRLRRASIVQTPGETKFLKRLLDG